MRRWGRPRFHPGFRPFFRPMPWLPLRWRWPLGWGWLGFPLLGVLSCLAVFALPVLLRLLLGW
jgi:hypothetical protein